MRRAIRVFVRHPCGAGVQGSMGADCPSSRNKAYPQTQTKA